MVGGVLGNDPSPNEVNPKNPALEVGVNPKPVETEKGGGDALGG